MRSRSLHLFLVFCLAFRLVGASPAPAEEVGLDGGIGWLNVERPLTLAELRGKVVLLDFWTFCCINCIHVIPDLRRLEAKYGNKLAVIGVHSAKFENEKDGEAIRQAILRYGIEHPVVNDANFAIWRRFEVKAWPSFLLLDPEGKIVARTSGEGQHAILDSLIGREVARFAGRLDERRLPLALEKSKRPVSGLAFPGKVLADPAGGRLFVSDSGNNRVIVTDLGGKPISIIGSGKRGYEDGAYARASFDDPQGLALDGDRLYVADRGNHLVRVVNLSREEVATAAGTGEQGYLRRDGKRGRDQAISSPWDLAVVGEDLYVAMAGWHQIWKLDLSSGTGAVAFGNGREDIVDGPAESASLAQPSGMASDGKTIYFADSEVSAVRTASIADGKVGTLVGKGLFDFGDRDGPFGSALLQHPLAVALLDGKVYVADSYNHKIKELEPATGRVRTVAGSGEAGLADGSGPQARFSEPAGLSAGHGALFVADTNNHRIRRLDPRTGRVDTVEISLPAVATAPSPGTAGRFLPNLTESELALATIGGGSDLSFRIGLRFEQDYHLNPEAPSAVRAWIDGERAGSPLKVEGEEARITVAVPRRTGRTIVEIEGTFYYCKGEKSSVCLLKSYRFVQPLEVNAEEPEERRIEVDTAFPSESP